MTNTHFAAALFPQHTKTSGAAAVINAADQAAADHQRLIDENTQLRERVKELETELSWLKAGD